MNFQCYIKDEIYEKTLISLRNYYKENKIIYNVGLDFMIEEINKSKHYNWVIFDENFVVNGGNFSANDACYTTIPYEMLMDKFQINKHTNNAKGEDSIMKKDKFIIGSINKVTGEFSISRKPVTHDNFLTAQQECERLVKLNLEKKFVVLEVKGICEIEYLTWDRIYNIGSR